MKDIETKMIHFQNVKNQLETVLNSNLIQKFKVKNLKNSFATCKAHLAECCDFIDSVKEDVNGVLCNIRQVQMVKSEFNSFIADSKISPEMIEYLFVL